jgi:hypothetical protein
VKSRWVGVWGRQGVVGKRTMHRQAEVSRRPTTGDHKGPHRFHTTALAPTRMCAYGVGGRIQVDANVPTRIRTPPTRVEAGGALVVNVH